MPPLRVDHTVILRNYDTYGALVTLATRPIRFYGTSDLSDDTSTPNFLLYRHARYMLTCSATWQHMHTYAYTYTCTCDVSVSAVTQGSKGQTGGIPSIHAHRYQSSSLHVRFCFLPLLCHLQFVLRIWHCYIARLSEEISMSLLILYLYSSILYNYKY